MLVHGDVTSPGMETLRGEVFRLRAPRDIRGHQQRGSRHAVVVQSDQLPLSTCLVAPTSTSARAASFRPEVEIAGQITRVLAEQPPLSPPRVSAIAWVI
jgi:mRNA interferase MazF